MVIGYNGWFREKFKGAANFFGRSELGLAPASAPAVSPSIRASNVSALPCSRWPTHGPVGIHQESRQPGGWTALDRESATAPFELVPGLDNAIDVEKLRTAPRVF